MCVECQSLRSTAVDLQRQSTELARDRDLADREVRRLRRENDLLLSQLHDKRKTEPAWKLVRALLECWRIETGHLKALIPPDGKRADQVRKALKWGKSSDRSEDEMAAMIRQAFRGAGRFPFVVDKKRAQTGPKECRYDDVLTVLRDERQLAKMAELADAPRPECEEVREFVTWAFSRPAQIPPASCAECGKPVVQANLAFWASSDDKPTCLVCYRREQAEIKRAERSVLLALDERQAA